MARLGSTSYDDAEPRDPQWQGATWYGQASGTYWTVNPKEYADPRKHGPEYQARGRVGPSVRETASPAPEREEGLPPSGATARSPGDDATTPLHRQGAAAPRTEPAPDGPTSFGSPAAAPPSPPASDAVRRGSSGTGAGPDRAPARGARPDGEAHPPLPPRVLCALIAWPVIGLAAAGLVGGLTGCARFSASCTGGLDLLPALLQPAILALLVAFPRPAEIAATGTLAVVLAAVPAAVLLASSGGAHAPAGEAPLALVLVLAVAWLVGVAAALSGRARLPSALRTSG